MNGIRHRFRPSCRPQGLRQAHDREVIKARNQRDRRDDQTQDWYSVHRMPQDTADLIIWDSTPAGLTAAIAAVRAGVSVIIVTEDQHVGGLQTSGLGMTNAGQKPTIGGITREFHRRVLRHYVETFGRDSQQVRDCEDGYRFEPHVAEMIWEMWLGETGVTCARRQVIESVDKSGAQLKALRTTSGRRFAGKVFIDASYEGDLLALAGCSYHLGREANDVYGEPLASVGDAKLQPFDYRCCLTNVADNRVPFAEPAAYDPANYAWFAWKMKQVDADRLIQALPLNKLPNGKTDSRTAEWPGRSWGYIEATRAERAAIDRAHRQYSAGYLWHVMTDAAVPPTIRNEAARWGLAADEFGDNDHWPWRIYVREGRRLIGEYVTTQRDCEADRFKADGVGVCSWFMDVHPLELIAADDGFEEVGLINEPVRPFELPWRSVLPRATEAENLLVPVALSASHVAFSAIRVEPVWMILGESCGVGAAMSVEAAKAVHDVNVDELRDTLRGQGQVIDAKPFGDYWPHPPR